MLHKQDAGLRVRPNRTENAAFPQFEKPRPVGYFSVVGGPLRDYEPSAQQLHYFKHPPAKRFPLDLNEGLCLAIKKPDSANDGSLEHLFKFIYDQRDKFIVSQMGSEQVSSGSRNRLNAEFVCWRGLLRLLMCTPYEFRQDWCIHVTRFNGTFYLRKRDTEQEKYQRASETERQRTMSAWGFKFEQYCLAESPFLEPDTRAPVDECGEFSCVFATKLGGMSMLYGAEMDGIISDQPVQLDDNTKLDSLKFVELKVRQGNLNAHQRQSYNRHKTRNWWCQSFLVGIQDLYVGMRNELGLVQRIEHMEVRSLPKQGANFWTPTACANFLIEFLLRLKEIMADVNCPYTIYEFYFNSDTARITYECLKGKSVHSFLPDFYIDLMQKTSDTSAVITPPPLTTIAADASSNLAQGEI